MPTTASDEWRDWPQERKGALLARLRRRAKRWVPRANQIPPDWSWFVWLILAGRGWGKTRTGAEWAADKARRFPGCRIALVAQAFADGRDTMVEGESGLLSIFDDSELRGGSQDTAWNRSMGELFLANGSRFKVFSSEKPRTLRGPQHHFAWVDEPATFYDAHKGSAEDTTWSNLVFGCRLTSAGSTPQIVATGTPKPVKLLTQRPTDDSPPGLLYRVSTAITRGHSDDNLANLAESYRREVIDPLRDTRLGRQELAAEVLEDVEGALWKREWFGREGFRVAEAPAWWQRAPVIGVDPADGSQTGDEQAYTIAGLGPDHLLYVVESEGLRVTVYPFARAVIERALHHGAIIVLERNAGQRGGVQRTEP